MVVVVVVGLLLLLLHLVPLPLPVLIRLLILPLPMRPPPPPMPPPVLSPPCHLPVPLPPAIMAICPPPSAPPPVAVVVAAAAAVVADACVAFRGAEEACAVVAGEGLDLPLHFHERAVLVVLCGWVFVFGRGVRACVGEGSRPPTHTQQTNSP
jgi:hypothetical protein